MFMIKRLLIVIGLGMFALISTVEAQTVVTNMPSYPTSINVLFVQRDDTGAAIVDANSGQYVLDGSANNPRPVPFESDYLPNVVHKEMTTSANMPAKEVQAIAARGFGWQKQAYGDINSRHPCFAARTCDVTNSTTHQAYYPGIASGSSTTAVQNTSQLALFWSNQGVISDIPAFTQYSKSHPGNYTVAEPDSPYLISVYDPIQGAYAGGHGKGMSQDGTLLWERGNNSLSGTGTRYPFWNRDQILAHYYTSVQLRHPNGALYWGDYRWNMLQFYPTNTAILYYENESRIVSMDVQNTGVKAWPANTTVWYKFRRRTNATGAISESGWYIGQTATGGVISAPQLPVGREETLRDINVTPPSGTFDKATGYTYSIIWDLRRGTQPFATDGYGWHTQEIGIKLRKRVPPPAPKNPPCQTPPCAQNSDGAIAEWLSVDYPSDEVQYQWRHQTSGGSTNGTTSSTSINRSLAAGNNEIYVSAKDTTEASNASDETLIFRALYDPFAPDLTIYTTLPTWTNLPQLTLTWGATDPPNGGVPGSQVKDYMVEQQINGGAWTTLVASTQSTTYQITSLTNNTTYSFRITARDWAGNQTQQIRTTTIDRDPPWSSLTAPSGLINKTWTVLYWTSSYDRAPITSFTIDRYLGTTWQPLYVGIAPADRWLFEGLANTTYALRIRATDAAGNVQSAAVNPQITFTTGTDATGLSKLRFPLVLSDNPATAVTSPDTGSAYPLPQP